MRRPLFVVILAVLISFTGLSSANAQGGTVHQVKHGETLYSIANRYGVTVDALLQYNGIRNANLVYAGQSIQIPHGYAPSMARPAAPMACARTHTVSAGETLTSIAAHYGVSVQELARYNRIAKDSFVYIEQSLCVPGQYAPQQANYAPPANAYHHAVVPGETLQYIADHYGVSYHDIVRANRIQDASIIVVGQVLVIPGYIPKPTHAPAKPPVQKHDARPDYAPAKPVKKYDAGSKHAPPSVPPPAPEYEKYYDDSHVKPVEDFPYDGKKDKPKERGSKHQSYGDKKHGGVPPAPEYQAVPKRSLLPLADHPIEVVINGGSTWVGEALSIPDPNDITTLVVITGGEYGQTVRLRSGDYEVTGMSDVINLGEFGPYTYVFRYIPPGDYNVWIEDPDMDSEKVPIKVKAGQRVIVDFDKGLTYSGPTFASPTGWYLASFDNPSKPGENNGGWSNILVKAPASGLTALIESEGGGYKAKCQTGAKGPGSCDFAGLMAGFYWVSIDGTDFTVKTYMDGSAYTELEFARQPGTATKEEKNAVGPVSYD